MTAQEIAARIDAHLQRFEKDPQINEPHPKYQTHPYYKARAWASGGWVKVVYVAHQGSDTLKLPVAEKYLAWLDAGNVGRHFTAQRQGWK